MQAFKQWLKWGVIITISSDSCINMARLYCTLMLNLSILMALLISCISSSNYNLFSQNVDVQQTLLHSSEQLSTSAALAETSTDWQKRCNSINLNNLLVTVSTWVYSMTNDGSVIYHDTLQAISLMWITFKYNQVHQNKWQQEINEMLHDEVHISLTACNAHLFTQQE